MNDETDVANMRNVCNRDEFAGKNTFERPDNPRHHEKELHALRLDTSALVVR